MSDAGSIFVNVGGRDVGLAALLTRLEGAMRQTDQAGARLSQTTRDTLASAQGRAAASTAQLVAALQAATAAAGVDESRFLELAGALSQEALAAGNAARADQILAQAMGGQGLSAIEAAAADRELAAANATVAASASQGAAFVQGMGRSLLGMVGPAAAAGAAIGALRSAISTAEEGFKLQASLDTSRTSIELLLRGVRDSGEVFAGAARFGQQYKLTQQETTEATLASIRVLRTSKAPIEDVLGVFARLKVLAPEKTFSDAARALGELQAGQLVSLEKMFNVPLAEAHKMKVEIDGGADAVLVLSRYLDRAGVSMDAVAAQSKGATGALRDAAVEAERLQLALGGGSGGPGLAILQAKTAAVSGLANVLSGQVAITKESTAALERYNAVLAALGGQFGPLITGELSDADAKRQQVEAARAQAASLAAVAVSARDDATAQLTLAQITAQSAQLAQQAAQAQAAQAGSMELAGVQARAAALADQQKSNADQVGAVDAQTHAVAMNLLAAQAQQAANRLFATGATGAAAAAQLANSSGQVDVMTAALYRLAAAQAAARLATLNTARTSAGFTDQRDVQVNKASGLAQQRDQEKAAALAAAEAERQYQKEIGNFGPTLARARADLAQLGKDRGTSSAEYIRQLTKIHQIEEQQTSAAKKGRGGAGAGAARLSDQQKLNNTLLGDQQRFADQSENLETKHQQKLLDIEEEFAKKSIEQERANEVSKRQSRADFYDKLTTDTKAIGPQIAQGLSAAYESAYAKAQGIAQAGNQKLADDYLKMKQRQISAEEDYQKKLADARTNKDKDEAARLAAIHKLQTDANAEEEKQLLAGGDANVNARDAALAAEQKSYEEQQGKIGTAAEQAAQRKIDAADRSGKKIDIENTKLREQEAILNRIGPRPAGVGGATTPVPGTPVVTPAVPGTPPTASLDTLAAALEAIAGAVENMKSAVVRAQGDTTSAVRNIKGAVMV